MTLKNEGSCTILFTQHDHLFFIFPFTSFYMLFFNQLKQVTDIAGQSTDLTFFCRFIARSFNNKSESKL